MIEYQLWINTLQSTVIAHAAWRGDINVFADVILKAMGQEFCQTDLEKLRNLLRSSQLRIALNSRDCALWLGQDKLLRMVDQQPSSLRAAKLRLAHHPGPNTCRYCLMTEAKPLIELTQEKDSNGHHVAGSFVHLNCETAWRRLRMQIAGEMHHDG
ncbi:MAG: hypothetical protein HYZ18_04235 [Pseudogulbenkiania sp.]|nr:hypothetical protein [Pseudogulbenkiania sp.]